jgi:dTDP-4-dehydrorhamnose 3,5-epimerase
MSLQKAEHGVKFHAQKIQGMFLIEPEVFSDERGVFRRHYCEREFAAHGISALIRQCNVSENKRRYTLRGFHYQLPPHSEGKTVSCLKGGIYDIVVDLRCSSSTYLQWVGIELNESNRLGVHVPPGCANAFLTLDDNCMINYLSTNFYHPSAEKSIRYNDSLFGFKWPVEPVVISDKDNGQPDYLPAQRKSEFERL